MKKIVVVSGKAKDVFKYIETLSNHKGDIPVKNLTKGNQTVMVDLKR